MSLGWSLIYILSGLADTIIVFIFYSMFCIKRSKITVKSLVFFGVLLTLAMFSRNYFAKTYINEAFLMIALNLIEFYIIHLLFKGRIADKYVLLLVWTAITILNDFMVVFIMLSGLGVSMEALSIPTVYRGLAIFLSKATLCLILYIIYRLKDRITAVINVFYHRELVVVFFFFIVMAFLIIAYFKTYRGVGGTNGIMDKLIVVSIVLMNLGMCFLYVRVTQQSKKQLSLQLEIKNKQIQANYYSDMMRMSDMIRSNRHDMRNYSYTLIGLMKGKKYLEVENYLSSLYEHFYELDEFVISKSPTLSSIISVKKKICEANQIIFDYEIRVNNITINNIDLTIVLGNILDNAIEASLKIEEGKRYINIQIRQVNEYLQVICNNTYHGDLNIMDGFIDTTKDEKEHHGIGLRNINRVVEKYDGAMKIDIEEQFQIKVILLNHMSA